MSKKTQIKNASASSSNETVRQIFNDNFNIIRDYFSTEKVSNNSVIKTNKAVSFQFPEGELVEGRYQLDYKNGVFSVTRYKGTQKVYNVGDNAIIGSKHQLILSGEIENNGGSVEIESGGELIIIEDN